jgi:hypothetical protein
MPLFLLLATPSVIENRVPDPFNFLYAGPVEISKQSSNVSIVTICNPQPMLWYQVWDPLTALSNNKDTMESFVAPAERFFTLFHDYNDNVKNDTLLYRPSATFDLISQEDGKTYGLVGTITDVLTNFTSKNPMMQFVIDTSNYLVYPNKHIASLPTGNFEMIMEIDACFLTHAAPTKTLHNISYIP